MIRGILLLLAVVVPATSAFAALGVFYVGPTFTLPSFNPLKLPARRTITAPPVGVGTGGLHGGGEAEKPPAGNSGGPALAFESSTDVPLTAIWKTDR
ncbi:hypothetical protein ACHAXT_006541 [Thalassiosira profunda]